MLGILYVKTIPKYITQQNYALLVIKKKNTFLQKIHFTFISSTFFRYKGRGIKKAILAVLIAFNIFLA